MLLGSSPIPQFLKSKASSFRVPTFCQMQFCNAYYKVVLHSVTNNKMTLNDVQHMKAVTAVSKTVFKFLAF